ncbi:hypothetical protein Syun_002617 [Stephania yunnanensis]|uniref:AP-3 complex subunit beta n=1 Tax=Stephania yunnanensis TaxID=152371 RepID=A0AAP0LI20_9MAGN
MFPQFVSTGESLTKASSAVFRIGTDAHLYDDPDDVSIAPLLDSRFDSEKCEALKRLLALIAQGIDVSNFFPQVVKNVATQSIEVKKLVYLYLLHYADKRPNEALLSINCFQKDLSDPNPLVRAWALRAMAGIRLHVIAPLVQVAVTKCARDPSVYVRKCAANALPKLHDLHLEDNASTLEEIVGTLLSDHSPGVVGAAAAAFNYICPGSLTLIGRNYKRLCKTLPDVEEWGQIILIGILLRYVVARGKLSDSTIFSSNAHKVSHSEEDDADAHIASTDCFESVQDRHYSAELLTSLSRCYIEGPDEYISRSSYLGRDAVALNSANFTSNNNDDDVKLLLLCTSPLFWSHNSAVVLAAAGVHWILAPREQVGRIVKPLLFLLRSFNASKYVVLCNIQVFAKAMPDLFSPHYEDFFICSSDSYQIKAIKLDILSTIATDSSIQHIFQEFQDYIKDPDRRFAADTVAAIGLCARRLPSVAQTCLEGLLSLIRQENLNCDLGVMEGEEYVLAQAVMSLKAIIKLDPASHEKVIIQLARSLDSIKMPSARAMIIWIAGQYNSVGKTISRMLVPILKYLARCFTSEAVETKHQILTTIVKVLLYAPVEDPLIVQKILCYVLQLAKCDKNYDIRDRARFLDKLLSGHINSEGLKNGVLQPQQDEDLKHMLVESIFHTKAKSAVSVQIDFRFYLPGSLSQIVLHAAPGYEPLPKPGSLPVDDVDENIPGLKAKGVETTSAEPSGTNGPDSLSGSLDGETGSSYTSGYSSNGSHENEETGSSGEVDEDAGLLIQFSDVNNNKQSDRSLETSHAPLSSDLGSLMSEKALESWLDGEPSSLGPSSSKQSSCGASFARISTKDICSKVMPKTNVLLDPTNGNGLKVNYSFSPETSNDESNQSPESIGHTPEAVDSSSNPRAAPIVIPTEEIASLLPGETMRRVIEVRFHHHLLPVKLAICCNGKKLPVKLRPDIGYFVKPLNVDIDAFVSQESKLRGMFECVRSCTFIMHLLSIVSFCDSCTFIMHLQDLSDTDDNILLVCRSIASKVLCNANLFLVSVDMPVTASFNDASGLCLRFSGEIISSLIPCLITLTVEGKCSEPLNIAAKVNCEDTIFGLNLLNRIVASLS